MRNVSGGYWGMDGSFHYSYRDSSQRYFTAGTRDEHILDKIIENAKTGERNETLNNLFYERANSIESNFFISTIEDDCPNELKNKTFKVEKVEGFKIIIPSYKPNFCYIPPYCYSSVGCLKIDLKNAISIMKRRYVDDKEYEEIVSNIKGSTTYYELKDNLRKGINTYFYNKDNFIDFLCRYDPRNSAGIILRIFYS